ncbi:MAG: putative lipid II flippase FtsW [Oscillospiraceae bacterium]|nr:putative lipid II flippase FtsW [Oscillospiraceae bacterium]
MNRNDKNTGYPTAVRRPALSTPVKKRAVYKTKSRSPVPQYEKERFAKFDIPLFIVILTILVFGLIMLLSASSNLGLREYNDSHFYFKRQIMFAGVGLVAMLLISTINYQILLNKRVVTLIGFGSFFLMVFVNLGFGSVEQGGSTRWLGFGTYTIQPSEILKFALIVVLAYMTQQYSEKLKEFKGGFVPFTAVAVGACMLMVWQKHLSGTIIMFVIAAILMFISPIKFKHIGIAILILSVLAAILFPIIESMSDADVSGRLLGWRNPEADVQDKTFQIYQSLVTIGTGGWFGSGLGNSRQKLSYLPATNNDFIFSIVCEELGFIGGLLVLVLFVVFILRGFYIATHARDRFGMMLAAGITAQIGVQAFLNIAVVTNSVPNTGITLPFFSYGGTSMLMLLGEIGVLLNISRKARIE